MKALRFCVLDMLTSFTDFRMERSLQTLIIKSNGLRALYIKANKFYVPNKKQFVYFVWNQTYSFDNYFTLTLPKAN